MLKDRLGAAAAAPALELAYGFCNEQWLDLGDRGKKGKEGVLAILRRHYNLTTLSVEDNDALVHATSAFKRGYCLDLEDLSFRPYPDNSLRAAKKLASALKANALPSLIVLEVSYHWEHGSYAALFKALAKGCSPRLRRLMLADAVVRPPDRPWWEEDESAWGGSEDSDDDSDDSYAAADAGGDDDSDDEDEAPVSAAAVSEYDCMDATENTLALAAALEARRALGTCREIAYISEWDWMRLKGPLEARRRLWRALLPGIVRLPVEWEEEKVDVAFAQALRDFGAPCLEEFFVKPHGARPGRYLPPLIEALPSMVGLEKLEFGRGVLHGPGMLRLGELMMAASPKPLFPSLITLTLSGDTFDGAPGAFVAALRESWVGGRGVSLCEVDRSL